MTFLIQLLIIPQLPQDIKFLCYRKIALFVWMYENQNDLGIMLFYFQKYNDGYKTW